MPLPTTEGVNALPLVAVLWDLLHQHAETNPADHSASSAQDGAVSASSSSSLASASPSFVPTHAVLTINVGQTENSSGGLPTLQSAKISFSAPDNTVQSHDVQHLDQLPANLISALQGATHSLVGGTIDIGSSPSFADALMSATIALPGSIASPPANATRLPGTDSHPPAPPPDAAPGGSTPDIANHPSPGDAVMNVVTVDQSASSNVSAPDLQAMVQAFIAATPDYAIASTGQQVVIYDSDSVAVSAVATKTVSFDFADGSTLSLIGVPMALPHPHIG